MDFKDTPEQAAFRAELREWLDDHAPRHASDMPASLGEVIRREGAEDAVEASRAWQATLHAGGWGAITWPREYGGRDAGVVEAYIFADELRRSDVPPSVYAITLGMVGPTIIAHGTAEQKTRYLERMVDGSELWCQLWSEPSAGSDLAGLVTRAEGDATNGWRLTGQKVWTSWAHHARWGLVLARTNPEAPRHAGLSCFIVDMQAPGVTVRPLQQMTGQSHFNEVWFEDAAVPPENLVGPLDQGWRVAMTTLMNERYTAATSSVGVLSPRPLIELAQRTQRAGQPAATDPLVRQELAHVWTAARLFELTLYRSLTRAAKGQEPGPEGSVMKLSATSLATELGEVGLRVLGAGGALDGDDATDQGEWVQARLFAAGFRIAGGTDEIQKTILGERVLGLPSEPQPGKGTSFRTEARQ